MDAFRHVEALAPVIVDFGSAGRMPAVVPEMMRRLDRRGDLDQVSEAPVPV